MCANSSTQLGQTNDSVLSSCLPQKTDKRRKMNQARLTFAVFSLYIGSSSAGPVAGILEQHNVYRLGATREHSVSLRTNSRYFR